MTQIPSASQTHVLELIGLIRPAIQASKLNMQSGLK